MGHVDFDHIEPGIDGIPGRGSPGTHHRPAFFGRELARSKPSICDGFARGAHGLPHPGARLDILRGERAHAVHRSLGGRLAPAMCELNANRSLLALHEGDQRLEASYLFIIPDAKIMLVDQANLFDGSCLDKDKSEAPKRITAQMHVVKATARVARTSAIMDHGWHDQAVLEGQAADVE